MNTYKVNVSKTVRIITWGCIILLFLIGIVQPILILLSVKPLIIITPIGILILVVLCSLPICAWPLKYIQLTEEALVLRKILGEIRIPYEQIEMAACYQPNDIEIRVFGIGGFGGFIGKFYNRQIGFYTAYVGSYSQAFLIKTRNGEYYMFSCEHREEVVEYLQRKILINW